MPDKTSFSQWDGVTPDNNSAVSGNDISEGCQPKFLNNAMRNIMAQIRTIFSTWGIGFVGSSNSGAGLDALGFTTFTKTLIDDPDASTALSTLGVSTFAKTILDDADATAVRSTINAQNNLGFQPINKAGDTGIGALTMSRLYAGYSALGHTIDGPIDFINGNVNFGSGGGTTAINGNRVLTTADQAAYNVSFPIGWVGLMVQSSGSSVAAGGTVAGSNISPFVLNNSVSGSVIIDSGGPAQAGTWQNIISQPCANTKATYFKRIS